MSQSPVLHRHGPFVHRHPSRGAHRHLPLLALRSRPVAGGEDAPDHKHAHTHEGDHGHGLIDDSIKRSKAGVRAVLMSLAVLGATAAVQTIIFVATGSIALLADVIHNFGDALTAVPLGIAFLLRSRASRARRRTRCSSCDLHQRDLAGIEAIQRLIHPSTPDHLAVLAAAGAFGYVGNYVAAVIRTRAGKQLDSPALIADGNHARADAYVSLAVIASSIVVALGFPKGDPLIGLGITLVILRITWQSWKTVRGGHAHQRERYQP